MTTTLVMDRLFSTNFRIPTTQYIIFIIFLHFFRAFEKHFRRCPNRVISFPNLGNDALLVVPCNENSDSPQSYMHLANFMRMGPDEQIKIFWKEVVKQMFQRLAKKIDKKVWLSTCGLGIFWLHIRMDSTPKYYTYEPYRDA